MFEISAIHISSTVKAFMKASLFGPAGNSVERRSSPKLAHRVPQPCFSRAKHKPSSDTFLRRLGQVDGENL
jgi:hypothetical protein